MSYLFYLLLLTILIIFLNKYLINLNFLVSETGDRHQKFASNKIVPLTGGVFLFLSFLYFINYEVLSFIFFSSLIFILGMFSDLKDIKSAYMRFMIQISIVLTFVVFNDLQLFNTKIYLLDKLLTNSSFNYIFVSFCILIVINGSNFFDGLNTLNIGYYLLISLIIFYLKQNQIISVNEIFIEYLLIVLLILFFLNLINKIYLGDSGSYLLGFTFSVFLIKLYIDNQHLSPFFIIVLLWYPSYETLFSIIRKNIMNKSPMDPDSNHLHQQIFHLVKRKLKLNKLFSNLLSANLINLYNLITFIISLNFLFNSQIQVLLILLNISLYTFIYFKLFIARYKKI
jgi:UDP-N-acetylmuramyl pentapeptide phosphotransferase/UDP-N-acetylglucosamine-1-phosphate transferase